MSDDRKDQPWSSSRDAAEDPVVGTQSKSRFWKVAGVIVALIALVWIAFHLFGGNKEDTANQGGTISAKETPASTCRKVQPWTDGPHKQVITDFDKKVDTLMKEWVAGKTITPAAKAEFEKVVIDESSKYPIVLARATKLLKLTDEDTNAFAAKLYDESTQCYTQLGEDTLSDLKVAIKISRIANYDIPADAKNSGVVNGEAVNADAPGILEGHRKGIQIFHPDGTLLGVASLFCLNEIDVKEELPPSKDVPREDRLTPKSSNVGDYRRPGDDGKGDDVGTGWKAPVQNDGIRPEAHVQTQVPNTNRGGGASSSTTQNPGSAGAGTSPGANSGTSDGKNTPAPPAQTGGNGANGSGGTGNQTGTGAGGGGASDTKQDPNLID